MLEISNGVLAGDWVDGGYNLGDCSLHSACWSFGVRKKSERMAMDLGIALVFIALGKQEQAIKSTTALRVDSFS